MNLPRVLIVIDNLHTGGVASSLYNYLHFVHNRMRCSLLVFNENSIDRSKVPADVEILMPDKLLHILGKTQAEIKKESRLMALYRIGMFAVARFANGQVARKLLWPFVDEIGDYDLALAYAQDDSWKSISKGCIDFVVNKVNAKHKAAMVHCDYSNFGGYSPKQESMLSRLDTIICVSESCVKSFNKCFPKLRKKVIACENFTNIEEIEAKATDAVEYPSNSINFVSVCRLSTVKGLARTINAFKELYSDGVKDFTWTIVGDGPERTNLEQQVLASGLKEKIIFVGNKTNPYLYIKNASVFLLPSLHEAAPMVYGEAEVLGVPILTTKTCSSIEMVSDRHSGTVVENCEDGIREGLKNWINGIYRSSDYKVTADRINAIATNQLDKFLKSINQ